MEEAYHASMNGEEISYTKAIFAAIPPNYVFSSPRRVTYAFTSSLPSPVFPQQLRP